MCGIVAGFNINKNEEPVNKFIIEQMQDQINRGTDGFGITFIDDKGNVKTERATELTKPLVDLYFNKSRMIIAHHRAPSSSENKISQTHPIRVENDNLKYNYLFFHNGHIINSDELKEKHEKLGYKYTTLRKWKTQNEIEASEYNDTESLAIEVARFIENETNEMETNGSMAFIMLQTQKKSNKARRVFYGRTTNPLKLSKTRDKIRLSSEGEGNLVKEKQLYSFGFKEFKIKKRELKIKESPIIIETQWHTSYNRINDYGQLKNNFNAYNTKTPTEYDLKEPADFDTPTDNTIGYNTDNIMGYLPEKPDPDDKYPGNISKWDMDMVIQGAVEENMSIMEETIDDFRIMLDDHEQLFRQNFDQIINDLVATIMAEMKIAVMAARDAYVEEWSKETIKEAEKKQEERQSKKITPKLPFKDNDDNNKKTKKERKEITELAEKYHSK